MFKKTIAVASAAVMALSTIVTGCGSFNKYSIVMDIPDEKTATLEFNNAAVDDFVQSGYISVEEGEGIEVVSDLNDSGKVLIGFIAVPEEQSIDELPDLTNVKYEMMISGVATQGGSFEPGEYDLKVTVQGKATGTVTLKVKPVGSLEGAIGMEYLGNAEDAAGTDAADDAGAVEGAGAGTTAAVAGGHTNWTQAATAEEAAKGAGLDFLADLNGTQTSLGVLGEMGAITYRYMDGVAQIFCPVAAVEMSVIKGRIPSGNDGDVSLDSTPYKYEWTQDVDGQEVKCFGNREGEATKTIWTAGDYNYAIVAYGAGGDDDFGLRTEDVVTMVNAVK